MILSNFERITYISLMVLMIVFVVGKFVVNEVVQQMNHIYFHCNNICHERFYGDPTTSLSYYVRR